MYKYKKPFIMSKSLYKTKTHIKDRFQNVSQLK